MEYFLLIANKLLYVALVEILKNNSHKGMYVINDKR